MSRYYVAMFGTIVLALSLIFSPVVDGYESGSFGKEESWSSWSDKVVFSEDLSEVPGAASRSAYRAPTVVYCPEDGIASRANGARSISENVTYYYPLAQGSFRKTSGFGPRIHPIYGTIKNHNGTDYSAPIGEPIHSIDSGIVEEASQDSSRGNYVKIKHEDKSGEIWFSQYFHQSSVNVAKGDTVSAGDILGFVGSTGDSTGAHLHLEILESNDRAIDPDKWMSSHDMIYPGQSCYTHEDVKQ